MDKGQLAWRVYQAWHSKNHPTTWKFYLSDSDSESGSEDGNDTDDDHDTIVDDDEEHSPTIQQPYESSNVERSVPLDNQATEIENPSSNDEPSNEDNISQIMSDYQISPWEVYSGRTTDDFFYQMPYYAPRLARVSPN
jgi:hypothetical protein